MNLKSEIVRNLKHPLKSEDGLWIQSSNWHFNENQFFNTSLSPTVNERHSPE